jgi:hypothetical protein
MDFHFPEIFILAVQQLKMDTSLAVPLAFIPSSLKQPQWICKTAELIRTLRKIQVWADSIFSFIVLSQALNLIL